VYQHRHLIRGFLCLSYKVLVLRLARRFCIACSVEPVIGPLSPSFVSWRAIDSPSLPSLVAGKSQSNTGKRWRKGTECGWVDIIYHDLSLLEAQNVGGGLDPENRSLEGSI
jgi:hypothetical protein